MEILLVEDVLTLARVTMGALRQGNIKHRLTWLTDGAEALQLLGQHGAEIGVVLLDLTMPGEDGTRVWQRIRDLAPALPVILMSGYDETDALLDDSARPAGFLKKPFTINSFVTMVRTVTGEP